MNLKLISDINKININDWEAFIVNHPYGTVFQSYSMYKLFEESRNFRPTVIIAIENDTIVGILMSVINSGIFRPDRIIIYPESGLRRTVDITKFYKQRNSNSAIVARTYSKDKIQVHFYTIQKFFRPERCHSCI